jgi:hypothetical protein
LVALKRQRHLNNLSVTPCLRFDARQDWLLALPYQAYPRQST